MRRIVGFLSLVALTACADIFAPGQQPLVDNAEPFEPPAIYWTWWKETEACSGKSRRMGPIDWYYVPGALLFRYDTMTRLAGLYQSPNRITLSDGARDIPTIVRHEILHALLRVANHPREYFGVKCKGLVDYDSTRP